MKYGDGLVMVVTLILLVSVLYELIQILKSVLIRTILLDKSLYPKCKKIQDSPSIIKEEPAYDL